MWAVMINVAKAILPDLAIANFYIGKKQYNDLGESQQRQRTIRFKAYTQQFPSKSLELISLQLRTITKEQLVNVEIQQCQ